VTKDDARQCDHRRSPAQGSCCFRVTGGRPVLLKPAVTFILLQQNNELSQKIWIISRSNCVFKKQWPHNSFPRHGAPNMNLWQMQRIFTQCIWVFSTPYRTVSIQVERCFVRKKQIVCHLNPFVWKPHVLDYRIFVELLAKMAVNCTKRISKCWKCSSRRGGGVSFLCLFQYLQYLHMYRFWVVSYTVHSVHVPHAFCLHLVYR
jgi:hypothetical protein